LITGCAIDVANRYYGNEKYAEKLPQDVELLWKSPNREFIVIADFQSRRESPEDIRAKAAKIGSDAVIISLLGGLAFREEWASTDRQKESYSRITGTAIKYITERK